MKKACFIFIIIFIYSSLALGQTEKDSVLIAHIKWINSTIQEGVTHKQATIKDLYGVTQHINIIEITQRRKKNKIGLSQSQPNDITSKVAKRNNAIAAINGSYFDMKYGNSVCYFQLDKQVIDTTATAEFLYRVNGAIREKRGKIRLIPWNKQREISHRLKKENILASGPLLIENRVISDFSACNREFIETKHPRSAIALTLDKKILLITVDGRFPGQAEGINIPELAHLIKMLGGKYALNLDGGGSTTLWHKLAPDNGVVNKPFDNKKFDNRGERKIPNIIYVYNTKKHKTSP